MNEPNKLGCYITQGWKYSSLFGPILKFMKKIKCFEFWPQGPCLQHFIVFVTHEWAQ